MNRFFFIIAALAVAASLASTEPVWVGTWKLNVAKSKGLNPAVKSSLVVVTMDGNARKLETRTVGADGKERLTTATLILDGKEHPFTGTGGPSYDTYISRSTGTHAHVTEFKRGGKVVRTVSASYSKDGNTRPSQAKGVNEQGAAYDTTSVYERQ